MPAPAPAYAEPEPRRHPRAVANGLFKGLTLQLFKGPIQSAVGFTANDYAKRVLLKWRDKDRGGGGFW